MNEDLISRSVDGDEDAFSELVDKTIDSLYRFVFRLVTNEQDAQDIIQDVYLKIWKNKESFRSDLSSFNTWMYSIARNTAIDFFRKRKDISFTTFEQQDGSNPIIDTLRDKELLPDELALIREDNIRLGKSIEKLPIYYREVVLLRGIEDRSFVEIAEILDRSIDTVKSQYRRAIRLLYLDLANRKE